jgi:hypothetical protein
MMMRRRRRAMDASDNVGRWRWMCSKRLSSLPIMSLPRSISYRTHLLGGASQGGPALALYAGTERSRRSGWREQGQDKVSSWWIIILGAENYVKLTCVFSFPLRVQGVLLRGSYYF